jgi:hypothetical protein
MWCLDSRARSKARSEVFLLGVGVIPPGSQTVPALRALCCILRERRNIIAHPQRGRE